MYRSSLEVFTSHKPKRPVLRALPIYRNVSSVNEVRAQQTLDIDGLQSCLNNMHREVKERVDANRQRRVEKHNLQTNVKVFNFRVGDFVLVKKGVKTKHKL